MLHVRRAEGHARQPARTAVQAAAKRFLACKGSVHALHPAMSLRCERWQLPLPTCQFLGRRLEILSTMFHLEAINTILQCDRGKEVVSTIGQQFHIKFSDQVMQNLMAESK